MVKTCRVLLFLSCFSLFSSYASDVYEGKKVGQITIVVDKAPLEERAEKAFLSRLRIKEKLPFLQSEFDEDLKVLAREFQNVEPSFFYEGSLLNIKLVLDTKPTIHSIIFQGNKNVRTESLQRELGIKEGTLYDKESFAKGFLHMRQYLAKKGYSEAECAFSIHKTSQEGAIDIIVHIQEGQSSWIEDIEFVNFTKEEEVDLLKKMHTKKYCWYSSWVTNEGVKKPEIFRMDEVVILNYLHDKGYLDATIETETRKSEKSEKIIITIKATKGEIYKVGTITLSGYTIFPEEKLKKTILLGRDKPFSPEQLQQSLKAIQDIYGKKGYVDISVIPKQKLRVQDKVYDVHFDIEEGEQYRVGIIKVFGNIKTDTAVILHESLLVPGELFDLTRVEATEGRLQNIGYFKAVNVYPVKGKSSIEGNYRDLVIEVQEKMATASLQGGAAFSTTEGVLGRAGVSENNFKLRGFTEIFTKGFKAIRGGGENLSFDVTIGSKMTSYDLSWTKPYVFDSKWTLGVDFNRSRNEYASDSYTMKSIGMGVHAYYPINPFLQFGTHYRLTDTDINLKKRPKKENDPRLIDESTRSGLISAVGADLSYDSADHILRPTKGLRSSIGVECAGLFGDEAFLKFFYTNKTYFSPYKGAVLMARADLHLIQTLPGTKRNEMPLGERLYLGGEKSVRGYQFNSLGPKFKDKDRTPRGGFSSLLGSLEYVQNFHKLVDGFVFFDVGSLSFDEYKIDTLRASWGYGLKLRIRENAGPIIIGFGYPLNPQRKEDTKRFFLTFETSF